MKTTTYTCDRCKIFDNTNTIDLITVKITLFNYDTEVRSIEWCRKCLVETGLLKGNNLHLYPEAKIVIPPPTIEDLIKEIIHQEVNPVNK